MNRFVIITLVIILQYADFQVKTILTKFIFFEKVKKLKKKCSLE